MKLNQIMLGLIAALLLINSNLATADELKLILNLPENSNRVRTIPALCDINPKHPLCKEDSEPPRCEDPDHFRPCINNSKNKLCWEHISEEKIGICLITR